jgi:hypothetical protein
MLDELRVAMAAAPTKRCYIRLNAIRSLLPGFFSHHFPILSDWCEGTAKWKIFGLIVDASTKKKACGRFNPR